MSERDRLAALYELAERARRFGAAVNNPNPVAPRERAPMQERQGDVAIRMPRPGRSSEQGDRTYEL